MIYYDKYDNICVCGSFFCKKRKKSHMYQYLRVVQVLIVIFGYASNLKYNINVTVHKTKGRAPLRVSL